MSSFARVLPMGLIAVFHQVLVESQATIPSTTLCINEIMGDPSGTGEPEWVELYNSGSVDVDLSGYALDDVTDGGRSPVTVAEGIITAGGFFVQELSNGFVNNGGDVVQLTNADGNLVHNVTLSASIEGLTLSLPTDCASEAYVQRRSTRGITNNITRDEINSSTRVPGEFRLGSWNIQQFGLSKGSKPAVIDVIVHTLQRYDIAFIQELQNEPTGACGENSGPVTCSILDLLPTTYAMEVSDRVGQGEQYVMVYDSSQFEVLDIPYAPYSHGNESTIYRQPHVVAVMHKESGDVFHVMNVHTRPDDATKEIQALPAIAQEIISKCNTDERVTNASKCQENIILLGDFNADGTYFDEEDGWPTFFAKLPEGYTNAIDDLEDTTTATGTAYAYDRIVVSGALAARVKSSNVFIFHDPDRGGFSMDAIIEDGCTSSNGFVEPIIDDCASASEDEKHYAALRRVSDHYPVEVMLTYPVKDTGDNTDTSDNTDDEEGGVISDANDNDGDDGENEMFSPGHISNAGQRSYLYYFIYSLFCYMYQI